MKSLKTAVIPQTRDTKTPYNKRFNTVQRLITDAIKASYFDIGEVPGDVEYLGGRKKETHEALVDAYVPTDKAPDFMVIIIADIVNGIKSIQKFYYEDFKGAQGLIQTISMDEYVKRIVQKIEGHAIIVGDKEGNHLDLIPVQMEDFIVEQIKHRVRFKYSSSSIEPNEDPSQEIKLAIGQTVNAYKFDDFATVELVNMLTGETSTTAAYDIINMAGAQTREPSRTHTIKFDYGAEKNSPKGL